MTPKSEAAIRDYVAELKSALRDRMDDLANLKPGKSPGTLSNVGVYKQVKVLVEEIQMLEKAIELAAQ